MTGTIASRGPAWLDPLDAGAWRAAIGCLALWATILLTGGQVRLRQLTLRWVFLGGVGVAVYQLSFFEAVARTGVAKATLIAIATSLLASGLIGWLAEGYVPARRWFLGSTVAIVGVAALTGAEGPFNSGGALLAVCTGISYPTYAIASQRLNVDVGPQVAIATVFSAGTILLFPWLSRSAVTTWTHPDSLVTVGALGLVTVLLAYRLWAYGAAQLRLGTIAILTLVEPIVASTLAVMVLGEPMSVRFVGGAAMVIAGVYYSTKEGGGREVGARSPTDSPPT